MLPHVDNKQDAHEVIKSSSLLLFFGFFLVCYCCPFLQTYLIATRKILKGESPFILLDMELINFSMWHYFFFYHQYFQLDKRGKTICAIF